MSIFATRTKSAYTFGLLDEVKVFNSTVSHINLNTNNHMQIYMYSITLRDLEHVNNVVNQQ